MMVFNNTVATCYLLAEISIIHYSLAFCGIKNYNMDVDGDKIRLLSPETKKRIELNRIRSDKISSLMGQYLLSGWRMLDEYCSVCQSILLMQPGGDRYCVGCSEVDKHDSSKTKDCKPVIDTELPSSKISNHSSGDDGWSVINKPGSKHSSHHAENGPSSEHNCLEDGKTDKSLFLKPNSPRQLLASILNKLNFCVDHFDAANSPHDIQQWAQTIKSLVETADVVSRSSIPNISDKL